MKNKILVGNVVINSVIKLNSKRSERYKVLEHKDGFTALRELNPDNEILELSALWVADWFTVRVVEGF